MDDVSDKEENSGFANPEIEELWMDEAERRWNEYLAGRMEASSGDEVMSRLRAKLEEINQQKSA